MKIALIGASGNVGSKITTEALNRGHEVTAIVRHPEKIEARLSLTVRQGDIADSVVVPGLLAGHDVVVSSLPFTGTDPHTLIAAVRASGTPRLLVVGGAGSLLLPDGTRVIDAPGFPDAYKPEASAGAVFLDVLKAETDLNWTFLSPSAEIVPGERTGTFRLAADDLLVDASGKSHISQEDYAVALVDEIEKPHHSRQRFTVGY